MTEDADRIDRVIWIMSTLTGWEVTVHEFHPVYGTELARYWKVHAMHVAARAEFFQQAVTGPEAGTDHMYRQKHKAIEAAEHLCVILTQQDSPYRP